MYLLLVLAALPPAALVLLLIIGGMLLLGATLLFGSALINAKATRMTAESRAPKGGRAVLLPGRAFRENWQAVRRQRQGLHAPTLAPADPFSADAFLLSTPLADPPPVHARAGKANSQPTRSQEPPTHMEDMPPTARPTDPDLSHHIGLKDASTGGSSPPEQARYFAAEAKPVKTRLLPSHFGQETPEAADEPLRYPTW